MIEILYTNSGLIGIPRSLIFIKISKDKTLRGCLEMFRKSVKCEVWIQKYENDNLETVLNDTALCPFHIWLTVFLKHYIVAVKEVGTRRETMRPFVVTVLR